MADQQPTIPGTQPAPASPRAPREQVQEELHPAQQFLLKVWTEYRTPFFAGLLMLVALALVLSYYNRSQREKTEAAAVRLNAAATIYNQVVLSREVPRAEAESQLRDAITYCQDVRDQYPRTEAARLALYLEGSCQFERLYHYLGTADQQTALESLDQAISSFRQYGEESSDSQDRARGLIAEAACYENRSFITTDSELMRTAISRLEEAAGLARGTYLEAQALIAKARCLEGLRSRDEARDVYQEVIRLRASLAQTRNQGPFGLTSAGGYNDLAQERLERIESGIDVESAEGTPADVQTAEPASPSTEG